MKNKILRAYLEALKEDEELDKIFPLLLRAMNFRIVSTPKHSKGMSQYGKDIVAIGKDDDGVIYRWYFELKGNAAKDINDKTFNIPDGVRDSILAAKDTVYEDSSIAKFNALPIKIVFVHTGILMENTRLQFDGFIKREFPDGGFERWDIDKLVALFTQYLFNECLLADDESARLFKKILVLIDAPGWDTKDLDTLIDLQLVRCPVDNNKRRQIAQCFASLNLLLAIIYQYAQTENNLLPAKKASDRMVLKIWAWMLRNHKDRNAYYVRSFSPIVQFHLHIYSVYMNKLLPIAMMNQGLYMFHNATAEKVCYPLRCYDFMNDLLYYLFATTIFRKTDDSSEYREQILNTIMTVIKHNPGFNMPLLDTHSITLLLLIRYVYLQEHTPEIEQKFAEWIGRMITNIILRKRKDDMLPELYGNRAEVVRSLYKKSPEYKDRSSLLLTTLVEIIAWINADDIYEILADFIIESGVNLQVAYPIESTELEINLFEHQLNKEMSVDVNIQLPETLDEFKKQFRKKYNHIPLRTETSRFPYLLLLAHIHYETDWFPDFVNFGFLDRNCSFEDLPR
ncbi:MAG: hypothetical protein IKY87_01745 [Paludibacteraceae bacterium]|nr:hypothetical protein [Paludibacteraceae bacterium]